MTGVTGPPVDDRSDSTGDSLSAGAAAGLAIALTLVSLSVGVALGCVGSWCICKGGRRQKQEDLTPAPYEEPDPPVGAPIPLSDNLAYEHVKIKRNPAYDHVNVRRKK